MSTNRDFDRIAGAWLAEGPSELADRVLDAALDEVHLTDQRRHLPVPWRLNPMPNALRPVAAALVGVLAVGVIYLNLPGRTDTGGPSTNPSPTVEGTPTPAPSPTQNALLDTATWTIYTSSQYGFKIGHPADWTVAPADRAWNLETDAADWLSTATDSFYTQGLADELGVRVSVWSVPFAYVNDEATEDVEAWAEAYCEAAGGTTCGSIHDRAVRLCIELRDCHPGVLLASNDSEPQAFFSGGIYGGEMVVVSVWRTDNDPSVAPYGGGRKLLETFLSTMCVWPVDERPAFGTPCLTD